jgi:hypothetical protein
LTLRVEGDIFIFIAPYELLGISLTTFEALGRGGAAAIALPYFGRGRVPEEEEATYPSDLCFDFGQSNVDRQKGVSYS